MAHKHILFIFLTTICMLSACDNISEDERYIYVKPAEVARAVLVEDFTGQRCINCPSAADEIKQLQAQYGSDKVIAVSIHGGSMAQYSTSKVVGLRTPLGDEYNDYWNIESWPAGLVDRRGPVATFDQWAAQVRNELERTSPVGLHLVTTYDTTSRTLTIVTTTECSTSLAGQLQLWITEDDITAPQQMPDGTFNATYLHQHVLRAAVNGSWGEAVSLKEGETSSFTHTITLDESWDAQHISVVAFIYDKEGVFQAVVEPVHI